MSDKLFTPINFPDPIKEEPTVIPPVSDDLEDISDELKEVDDEMLRAQNGTSKVIRHAIHFSRKSAVASRLFSLKQAPTQENLKLFIEIVQQDMGLAHARYFGNVLKKKVPEVSKYHG